MKTQKERTQGKFVITANGKEIHNGHSTQCEIMFRDYCGWCKKGKAPKSMQTAFDDSKLDDPTKLFKLQITKMTDEEFTKATAKTPKTKKETHVKLLEKLAAHLKDHPEHTEEIRKAITEMTATQPAPAADSK